MWSYLKTAVLALATATCIYGVLFVDVAGKPLAAHAVDVWRSPLVQHKVHLLKRDVQQRLERTLRRAETASKSDAPVHAARTPGAELSQADRESLSALIDSVRGKP